MTGEVIANETKCCVRLRRKAISFFGTRFIQWTMNNEKIKTQIPNPNKRDSSHSFGMTKTQIREEGERTDDGWPVTGDRCGFGQRGTRHGKHDLWETGGADKTDITGISDFFTMILHWHGMQWMVSHANQKYNACAIRCGTSSPVPLRNYSYFWRIFKTNGKEGNQIYCNCRRCYFVAG